MRSATAPAGGKRPQPSISGLVGYETFAGRVCQLASGSTLTPGQVAALTFVIGALAGIFTLRNLRVAAQLADRGGDPQLRRARNRIRERRGF